MKKETRGRKPTGRYRDKILSAKFTEDESAKIVSQAKEVKMKQHDFITKACDAYFLYKRSQL